MIMVYDLPPRPQNTSQIDLCSTVPWIKQTDILNNLFEIHDIVCRDSWSIFPVAVGIISLDLPEIWQKTTTWPLIKQTNILNSFEQFLWNSDHSVHGLLMYFSSSSRQWVHCVRSPRDIEEKATHQGDEAKPEVILIIIIFWEAAAKLCRKLPTLLDITSSPSPLESAMEAKLQGDQIIQDLYFKLGT